MPENQPKPAVARGSGEAKSEVARREEEILALWEERDIFKKTLAKTAGKKEFVFYEGPPTANGRPGIHHLESRAFKDAIPRFRTMQGYHVRRKAGWDTHGLPVELEVEKKIGSKNKKDIEAFGIAKFNALCKESVLQYIDEWEKFSDRIAFWQDYEHTYFTFDNSYIESVWNILKTAHERKLLYKDYKVVPWCPRCGTALSSHEVAQGYQDDTKDPSVYVKFKVRNPEKLGLKGDVFLLAWTTTPWTLPGNVALAVNLGTIYRVFDVGGAHIIAALDRGEPIGLEDTKMRHQFMGKELVGLEYEPLFPYLANSLPPKEKEKLPNAYKVYAADFVSTTDGTGIVHTAVMYGTDDFELGTKVGLPKHHLVGEDGKFTTDAGPLVGQFFKKADDWVMDDLEKRGLLFKKETILHTYPFCWRCKTPLMYYADDSWYIAMSKTKQTLIRENEKIHWEPEHIREGRFGEWLKDLKDWAISRSRFWGTPLPIWECGKCKHFEVIGSIAELKQKTGNVPNDLHRPFIDEPSYICSECGGSMKRVPEVLDVWFDSGAMPFAQDHYPFATKDILYPADYICEAIDQTRGWFYTLHAVGAGIMDRGAAYKNVICLGHILDAKGKKMSKSVGNVVEPWSVIDKYGVDALRFFMFTVNAPGDSKNFDEKIVDEIVKKNLGRLGNVLAFYKLYENGTARGNESTHVLDRWILARLNQLVGEATSGFENYKIDAATRPIAGFIDDLSVWYLRRSRDRFKEDGNDKNAALATFRFVLYTVSKLMAPSMPFFAEYLFQAVKENSDEESVHLSAWPEIQKVNIIRRFVIGKRDSTIEKMNEARTFVTQALEQRDKAGIKVRQPLPSLNIPTSSVLSDEYFAVIAGEVNVKEVKKEGNSVVLDTNLTDELREEGVVRDSIREIQAFRKESGLKPGEQASYRATFSPEQRKIVEKNLDAIQKATHTTVEFE
ncbi:MAG TPA: isoleucine--tRNA ligase [Candidatus Paceibacterota bacterium]|nr:isoleucine--tRNA ligase [Candidatus Paceibacterota bacterium]